MAQVKLSFAACIPPAAHIHALTVQIAHVLDLFLACPVGRAVQILDYAWAIAIGHDQKKEQHGRPGKHQYAALDHLFHCRGGPNDLGPVPHGKRAVADETSQLQRITQGRRIAVHRADSGGSPKKHGQCPEEAGAQAKPWPPAGRVCFLMAVLGLHGKSRNRAGCTVQKTPHPWW